MARGFRSADFFKPPVIDSSSPVNRSFATTIWKRRMALKLTRRDISSLTNNRITATDISLYERGRVLPRTGKLIALLEALQLEPDTLEKIFKH